MHSTASGHRRSPFQFPGQPCELHPNAGDWLQRLGGALTGRVMGFFGGLIIGFVIGATFGALVMGAVACGKIDDVRRKQDEA